MTGRRPISAVDTMWLGADRTTNRMVIESVMLLADPVDPRRLAAVLEERVLGRYPVFRQRPVPPPVPLGVPHWEDDPDFRLDRHLCRARLRRPGNDAALQRYVEAQMERPLDPAHPLWEVHLVDGYLGGAAVVGRFHHAIADGIALEQVLLAMTDPDPEGAVPPEPPPATGDHGGALALLAQTPSLLRPGLVLEAPALAVKTGRIAYKLTLGHEPATVLHQPPGTAKRAVWSAPRSLSDVKRVGRLSGATVNDVLMSALSGSLSTYLAAHGGTPTDLTTMVPVNLRPLDEPLPELLGNRFALVLLRLPSGSWAPLERLAETKRRMDAIKDSPESLITFSLIQAIGRMHPSAARALVSFFAGKCFGVTTNVAGPLTPRYLAGSRITGILGWVPGSGSHTLGVCLFTYDGTVRAGFKADADAVPDPEQLVEAFDAELDALVRIAKAA